MLFIEVWSFHQLHTSFLFSDITHFSLLIQIVTTGIIVFEVVTISIIIKLMGYNTRPPCFFVSIF
jgi:hypothetical protein